MKEDFVVVHLPTWEDVERFTELLGRRKPEVFAEAFHRYKEFCVRVREIAPEKYSFLTWGTKKNYSNYPTHVTIDQFAEMCGEKPEKFHNNNLMEVLLNG